VEVVFYFYFLLVRSSMSRSKRKQFQIYCMVTKHQK